MDISVEMVRLAHRNVPTAHFLNADIMNVGFAPSSFDAVVAFYSIFHVPREEQAVLFSNIRRWLKPTGLLLCTLNIQDEPPYTENDFFGATMFWSNFDLARYVSILESLDFDILNIGELDHDYTESDLPPERHPLVLAQLRPTSS